jgi:UDP-glucose 4-epimerase
MRLLVTGGAGYIGTHLVIELLNAGHDIVVVDNFSSGYLAALERAQSIAGRSVSLFTGDIADTELMVRALQGVEIVFHLAASKKIGESMEKPELYFQNNIGGMAALLSAMQQVGVSRIVYSSSAAVYGPQPPAPIIEDSPLQPENPYGFSKVQGEQQLAWMVRQRGWSAISLRYFNPVGAHPSGRIGEPFEQAASLVPRALKALTRDDDLLTVFGTDYDTPDGTCLRDYIHVCDLARAHLAAIEGLDEPGHHIFNVGTGRPHSVREVLSACERVTGRTVPAVDGARREGDVSMAVADPGRFHATLGFQARSGLDEMVQSAWRWWVQNPTGYTEGAQTSRRWSVIQAPKQSIFGNLAVTKH